VPRLDGRVPPDQAFSPKEMGQLATIGFGIGVGFSCPDTRDRLPLRQPLVAGASAGRGFHTGQKTLSPQAPALQDKGILPGFQTRGKPSNRVAGGRAARPRSVTRAPWFCQLSRHPLESRRPTLTAIPGREHSRQRRRTRRKLLTKGQEFRGPSGVNINSSGRPVFTGPVETTEQVHLSTGAHRSPVHALVTLRKANSG